MASQRSEQGRCWSPRMIWTICLAILAVAIAVPSAVWAFGFRQAVGGIFIDARGAVTNAQQDQIGRLRELRLKELKQAPADLNRPAELRKVSLRLLDEAIGECLRNDKPLPDEITYLAGLQRIEYVFVYPEQNDIILAGYGEGWRVDERGNVVGVTTGRPVLLLDDLLVALRTAEQTAQGGISCSIDPTKEGLARLQEAQQRFGGLGTTPEAVAQSLERLLGPQIVTIQGVPAFSHFARVLLAADFRMKRLGMNFDRAPVKGLPSYLHMLKSQNKTGSQNMLPRWWLTTDYEPLLTDGEGLAWQLRGPGVKAMSEDDFVDAQGGRTQSGKASPLAQKWADNMTAKYDELSIKEPIFGELRNCMDLAVVSALIVKERLATKAGLSMGALLDADVLPADEYLAPKQIDTRASFIETGSNYIISASGGVAIHAWGAADAKETSDELAPVRSQVAEGRAKTWWWN
ncbi:MAG TPA: DUF1598 domain-containing protein [Pirellulales bacterium]|nr:DUF1598 domain-containing protein [Pirellulales bacterium]